MKRLLPDSERNIGMFLGLREGYQSQGSRKEGRKNSHALPLQGCGPVVEAKCREALAEKVVSRLALKDLLVFNSDREG